jgi:outer membrane immunogenic protein
MRRHSPGLLVGIAVAASVLATAASAADMPVPGPAPAYYPPAYRPVIYDWTGLYGGVHLGAGLLEDQVTTTTTTALQPSGTQTKLSPFAAVAGAQAGFNYQIQQVVVGAESTFTWSDISGTQATVSPLPTFSETSISKPRWYATATGKFGFAANDFLFYAKGGAAWMGVNYTQATSTGTGNVSSQTITDTRSGFTAGGGIEFGMTENLSARLEYDYLNFGTKNYTFANLNTAPAPLVLPVAIRSSTSLITVGINYRFNWGGGGAVVTR